MGVPVLSSDGACSVKLLAQAPKIVPLFPHLKAVSEFEVRSVAKRSLDFGPDRNVVLRVILEGDPFVPQRFYVQRSDKVGQIVSRLFLEIREGETLGGFEGRNAFEGLFLSLEPCKPLHDVQAAANFLAY